MTPPSPATRPIFLHGGTGNRAIGAVDAAVAGFGLEQSLAPLAVIEPLTCVGWHDLGLRVTALRTGDCRVQFNLG